MASTLEHVCSSGNGNAICDVADAVEERYGLGICTVSVGCFGGYGSALYVDRRWPTWRDAVAYARELIQWPADPCNCGDAECAATPGHCGAYRPN